MGPTPEPRRDADSAEGGLHSPAVARDRVLRGIPLWLVRDYLVSLGARPVDGAPPGPILLAAETWQARLEQAEDFQVGSLRVGQVRLSLGGEDGVLRPLVAALDRKLMRGGG